jgi:methionyl-tRNA formyltransferase
MKLIFAGTPEFARTALQSLLDAGHEIVLVLTQPDRPAGRGMKLMASPVKQLAQEKGIPVRQPTTLKNAEEQAFLAGLDAEAMIVAAYGLILPQAVLNAFPRGCLNIHASLLPRWRGAAPIQRAILAGDAETGITIMQMGAGLDTGAMLLKKTEAITEQDTAQTLHDRLAIAGGEAIVAALSRLDGMVAEAQDNALATYAAKLLKEESRLDWSKPALQLAREVRAFNPFPVSTLECNGEIWRVWRARPAQGQGEPGILLNAGREGIEVAAGEGSLLLLEIQRPGGKRLEAAAFLQGHPLRPGECVA